MPDARTDLAGTSLYGRPAAEVMAALRVLRCAPAPVEPAQARQLRAASDRVGRAVVDVTSGRVILAWSEHTDGLWAGEATDGIRSARPGAPRLVRALAGCLRCCWPDASAPLYPSRATRVADVLAAIASLGAIKEAGESGAAVERHAKGALTTLDAAGLIELDRAGRTVRLGPVMATWPERDVAVLRGVWSRLPAPPASHHGLVGQEGEQC